MAKKISPVSKLLSPIFANAPILDDVQDGLTYLDENDVDDGFSTLLEAGKVCGKYVPDDTTFGRELLICVDDCQYFVLVNEHGQCFRTEDRINDFAEDSFADLLRNDSQHTPIPDGQLIPSIYEDRVFDFISNGDTDLGDTDALHPNEAPWSGFDKIAINNQATLSFSCLGMFDNRKGGYRGSQMLREGLVTIVDWTADERRPINKSDLKKLASKDPVVRASAKPPQPGFVSLGDEWHRSGYVLLKFGKQYLLFGVDEGSYFGCQLPSKADSVSEALDILVPAAVKNKSCPRQGEWFLEAIPKDKVPSVEKSLAYCSDFSDEDFGSEYGYLSDRTCFTLPKADAKSNTHLVFCSEWRVGKDGVMYALDPEVIHRDHATVGQNGWVRFHENTAVQSFSIAGVD